LVDVDMLEPNQPLKALASRLDEIPSSATIHIADSVTEMRRQGIEIFDLSAGRAVEPTPAYIREAAAAALLRGDTHQTPARGTWEFRQAAAAKLARDYGLVADPARELIATMGTKQGLALALFATIDPGDEVIIEDPCFVSYRPLIRLCGGTPVPVPLRAENRYRWTREDLVAGVTSRTKAILFNSPHNPTGTVHTEADLDVVVEVARSLNLVVITDEVYERVTWRGRLHVPIVTRPGMRDRTITVVGLTKTFSMGGWRIGFALAPPDVAAGMVRIQQHLVTCAGSFAQAGGARALAGPPPDELRELWADWGRRCEWVATELGSIPGIGCRAPEGGFFAWADVTALGSTSEAVAEMLLRDYRVAVIPGSAFGGNGEGHLRLTCVRSWDELRDAVQRIRGALTGGVSASRKTRH
jgi:aspartate aminotransferase